MNSISYISELKLKIRNTREDCSTAIKILNQLKERYSRYHKLSPYYNLDNFYELIKEREIKLYLMEENLDSLLKEAQLNNILV